MPKTIVACIEWKDILKMIKFKIGLCRTEKLYFELASGTIIFRKKTIEQTDLSVDGVCA